MIMFFSSMDLILSVSASKKTEIDGYFPMSSKDKAESLVVSWSGTCFGITSGRRSGCRRAGGFANGRDGAGGPGLLACLFSECRFQRSNQKSLPEKISLARRAG